MKLKTHNKLFRATFVLRHRWERKTSWEKLKFRNNFKLGIWLRTYKAVGEAKGPIKFIFSAENLVKGYMFGIDLIFCTFWIDITSPRILTFDAKEIENN